MCCQPRVLHPVKLPLKCGNEVVFLKKKKKKSESVAGRPMEQEITQELLRAKGKRQDTNSDPQEGMKRTGKCKYVDNCKLLCILFFSSSNFPKTCMTKTKLKHSTAGFPVNKDAPLTPRTALLPRPRVNRAGGNSHAGVRLLRATGRLHY